MLVLVVTASVDDVIAGFGVKLPLEPLGEPLTLRVTWPVKPPVVFEDGYRWLGVSECGHRRKDVDDGFRCET